MPTVTDDAPKMNIPGLISLECRRAPASIAPETTGRARLASCAGCHWGLVPPAIWYELPPEGKDAARFEGRTVAVAPGWCGRCYYIAPRRTRSSPPALVSIASGATSARGASGHVRTTLRPAERLEDLAWMAGTGESLAGAAMRLGSTEDAIEAFLRRHGGLQVLRQLRAHGVDLGAQLGAAQSRRGRKVAA
jgi:hypothetical protein